MARLPSEYRSTVQVNGQPIRAVKVSFNSGVQYDHREYASRMSDSFVARVAPSIKIDRPDPRDLSMCSTILDAPCCHVQIIGPTKVVYKFPQERFVQYEPKDEEWCRYFGLGKDVQVRQVIEMEKAYLDYADLEELIFKGQVVRKEVEKP
jgi:hypothetical protein